SLPPRSKTPPGVLVRALVSLGAIVAIVAAVVAYARDPAALGPGLGPEFVALVVVGALTRRYGIALPGNGFASYILGVMVFAVLDRGWPCAALVAPVAMGAGDLVLRRLPARAALGNAAHLTAGTAVVGAAYERLGGAGGGDALTAANLPALAVLLVLLPVVVNSTFYLELSLGRTLAWVDAWLTARWETIVYGCSAALALAWLRLVHAGLGPVEMLAVGAVLAAAVRLRRRVVGQALGPDQVVVPGEERPGAEVLVPLYHAGQLVGLWSVRHSDPLMYRETDGEMLALLAPQLALLLAIEASVQPVVGASERTTTYIETLTAT